MKLKHYVFEELKEIEIIFLIPNEWHNFRGKYLESFNSTNHLISVPSVNLVGL